MYNFKNNKMIEKQKVIATKEQREIFLNIMNKITGTKTDDRYPDLIYYMVGDLIYMTLNKNGIFHIKYTGFWSVFESLFNFGYDEIRDVLCVLLEDYLNIEANATIKDEITEISGLEEHLKNVKFI